MDYRIVFEKGRATHLGTQIDMAEEKRNCEWCVRGVVQKLFIFQLVVAPHRALLHSQCPSAAARARAYLPKLQFIMCVKINILPVEKRG
jgi:hypothetical protein